MRSLANCALVINVSRGDVPTLNRTLPHLLTTHKFSFAETIVVVDGLPAQGRIARTYRQYSLEQLLDALRSVKSQGYEFRQVFVDYSPEVIHRTMYSWFGTAEVTIRCAGGTPIYAFLYALDQAKSDYRLHLDSDMIIYDPGPSSWVDAAINILQTHREVMFVNQHFGPTDDDERFALKKTQEFSTRCFLFSMSKLRDGFLPVTPEKHPIFKRIAYRLERRSPYLALEQMIAAHLRVAKMYRCDLDASHGFNVHACDKQIFTSHRAENIIRRIEAGDVPDEQMGKDNLESSAYL